MPLAEKEIYRFDRFVLDPVERILSCDGTAVSLTPKAFDTLVCLVRNQGHMVTKDELLRQVWPDTFVEEINLAVNISTIRKALGESAQECRFIATVPGHGYRFVAEARNGPNHNGNAKPFHSTENALTVAASADHEIGSEPVLAAAKRDRSRFAILVIAVLLIAAILVTYSWRRVRRISASTPSEASIAVLPFTDLSPQQDQQYFTDGLAEELINNLGHVPGLKVVARSSAFEFRGRNENLRSVGHKLGVSNILEGSVRREGDRFRITVELTSAESGFQLWSQTYDRKINDIFAVQDEIAAAVSGALEITLLGTNGSAAPAAVRRTSPEAYQAYLQGRYFQGRGENKDDLEKAFTFANQAIELDARYAPAWVLRSTTYNLMAGFGLIENTEGMRKARQDAEHAIALDPNLASAYLSLGDIQLSYDWDWSGAEASGKRAAELEPASADVLRYQSLLTEVLGRLPEAIEAEKKAIMLDPLLARSYTSLGAQLYELGNYEGARIAFHKALELNPQKEHDHAFQGEVSLAQGRPEQALAEIEQEPSKFWKRLSEALAYAALKRLGESDVALNAVIATDQNGAAFEIGEVYAYRGESDKAFAWLNRAYRERDGGLTYVKVDPLLKNLRRDPRYADLLREMHLPM